MGFLAVGEDIYYLFDGLNSKKTAFPLRLCFMLVDRVCTLQVFKAGKLFIS